MVSTSIWLSLKRTFAEYALTFTIVDVFYFLFPVCGFSFYQQTSMLTTCMCVCVFNSYMFVRSPLHSTLILLISYVSAVAFRYSRMIRSRFSFYQFAKPKIKRNLKRWEHTFWGNIFFFFFCKFIYFHHDIACEIKTLPVRKRSLQLCFRY